MFVAIARTGEHPVYGQQERKIKRSTHAHVSTCSVSPVEPRLQVPPRGHSCWNSSPIIFSPCLSCEFSSRAVASRFCPYPSSLLLASKTFVLQKNGTISPLPLSLSLFVVIRSHGNFSLPRWRSRTSVLEFREILLRFAHASSRRNLRQRNNRRGFLFLLLLLSCSSRAATETGKRNAQKRLGGRRRRGREIERNRRRRGMAATHAHTSSSSGTCSRLLRSDIFSLRLRVPFTFYDRSSGALSLGEILPTGIRRPPGEGKREGNEKTIAAVERGTPKTTPPLSTNLSISRVYA